MASTAFNGPRRAVVIGLDGATWEVLRPLGQAGRVPHLWGLAQRGCWGLLRSTLPPMTFPAFPSLLTGLNPGRHGILGPESVDLQRGTGPSRLAVGSGAIAGRTVLDLAGQAGRRVLSYGVPMTYPAWPIAGVLVAGYPTPDPFRLYAEPPEAVAGLTVQVPERLAKTRGLELAELLDETRDAPPEDIFAMASAELESVAENVAALLERESYDLVMFVIRAPDIAHHGLWSYRDPRSPAWDPALAARYGGYIDQIYERVDAAVGRLLERFGNDWLIALASDHGGGPPPTRRLHLNYWFYQQGWLAVSQQGSALAKRAAFGAFRQLPGRSLLKSAVLRALSPRQRKQLAQVRGSAYAVDWTRTRCYAVKTYHPGGGVQVNLRGRQPQGIVEPGEEYERLRNAILEGLLGLRDPETGERLIEEAYRREEVYHGPHLEAAPDIVYLLNPDYFLDDQPGQLVSRMDRAAARLNHSVHRQDGILALTGPGVFRAGVELPKANILDVAPTLLYALGLPLPEDLDGRVLEEAFEPAFLQAHPVHRGGALGDTAGVVNEYTEEEEEGIRAALRELGYVE